MDHLRKILEQDAREAAAAAQRYTQLPEDQCQLCHVCGADKRCLFMDCGYKISEAVPEFIDLKKVDAVHPQLRRHFFMRICKTCRARLLEHLEQWAEQCKQMRGVPKDHDGMPEVERQDPNRNIPVRINGATVMLTREEYDKRYKGGATS